MRRRWLWGLVFLAIVGAQPVWAEGDEAPEYGWKNELVAGLNFTQTSFENWAQGGENSLAWQATLNGRFTNLVPRREWVNSIRLAYGMTKVGEDESRKSIDEIKLESVLTYKAGFMVDPYLAATAQTQFSKGYAYTDTERIPISAFLDPGYFTQSAGVGRSYKDVLRSRLGAAVKETVTDKYPIPYADDPSTPDEIEKSKTEVGMESVTDLSLKLAGDLLFTSKLELFSNLEASKEIDINWDNLVTAKVHEYVNVTFNVCLFYDRDISTKRQLKQALALGLSYTLM